mgnify:CR=1 FL=1|tara:strand:+ start:408 stop:617 length:210 start_codon:yes stop_codon:yes gene_type:complete
MDRNKLQDIFTRFSSRRLLVFIAGTGLLLTESLTGEQWVTVAGLYLASDAGPKIAERLGGAIWKSNSGK